MAHQSSDSCLSKLPSTAVLLQQIMIKASTLCTLPAQAEKLLAAMFGADVIGVELGTDDQQSTLDM